MKDKKKLSEWEKKQKRRGYMRKYYLKRKFMMINGNFTRDIKKKPLNSVFSITRGEFIVSFS
mgnify:CR=1 FL=1|tara:strand:- start:618 stop:803 length:186 start_codon:yes stop_codon:yes gene_type:complete